MILFCEQRPDFGWSGYGYALALFVVVFLQTLILQQYQRFKMLTSAKIKTAVIGLIYKKVRDLRNSKFLNELCPIYALKYGIWKNRSSILKICSMQYEYTFC